MDPVTEDLYFLVASRPEVLGENSAVKKVEISVGQNPPDLEEHARTDVSG